jgi:flagellar biosynthesis protein FlhB
VSEKQFDPTPRRLQRARREGNTPRSKTLSLVCSLGGALGGAVCSTSWYADLFVLYTQALFRMEFQSIENIVYISFKIIFFTLGLATLAGSSSEVLQVGVQFSWEVLSLKVERFDLAKGLLRCFSGLKQVGLLLLQVGVVIGLSLTVVLTTFPAQAFVREADPEVLLFLVWKWLEPMWLVLGIGGVAYGAISVVSTHRRFLKVMKMSLREILEELRETEGNGDQRAQQRAEHAFVLRGDVVRLVKQSRVIVID